MLLYTQLFQATGKQLQGGVDSLAQAGLALIVATAGKFIWSKMKAMLRL